MKKIGFDFGTTNSTISFYNQETKSLDCFGEEKSAGAASVIIRLARDTFALLPVSKIILNVDNIPTGISGNAAFERDTFASFTFENKNPIDLLNCLCR